MIAFQVLIIDQEQYFGPWYKDKGFIQTQKTFCVLSFVV